MGPGCDDSTFGPVGRRFTGFLTVLRVYLKRWVEAHLLSGAKAPFGDGVFLLENF